MKWVAWSRWFFRPGNPGFHTWALVIPHRIGAMILLPVGKYIVYIWIQHVNVTKVRPHRSIGSSNLRDNLDARNFSAICLHGVIMYVINYYTMWTNCRKFLACKLSREFGLPMVVQLCLPELNFKRTKNNSMIHFSNR